MRGLKTLHLLEKIADGMENIGDIMEVFLTAGYGGVFPPRFEHSLRKLRREKNNERARRDSERQARDRYYKLLYKLKKDGLIEIKEANRNRIVRLTSAGLKKLAVLSQKKKNPLPPPSYQKEKSDKTTIVVFDIPEKERGKRDWLRRALHSLEFISIQKSVWIGKKKIPANFLEDLKLLELLSYVEIFQITKTGTLKQIG